MSKKPVLRYQELARPDADDGFLVAMESFRERHDFWSVFCVPKDKLHGQPYLQKMPGWWLCVG